jgi:hypothetical protein
MTIDFKGAYAYGITAKYDKLTPVNNIKAVLDRDYGQWAVPSLNAPPVMMWRVEPEKFTVQLSAGDDGTPQLIYLTLKPELR